MEKLFGIDISYYEKGIDLSKAKNEGIKFIILRGGVTGYGTGTSKSKDTQFETFYKQCKNLNIPVGAYWYSCANTYEKGKAEAEFMYNNCLKGKQFEYPIYIDVEDTHWQQPSGKTAITNAIKGFCEYLESKGYYVGIYANSNWFKNYIDTKQTSKYDNWIANWGKTKPSTPVCGLWQFGGETNKLRSTKIADYTVDQDYAYIDYPKIMKEKGLNGFSKIEVKEDKEDTKQSTETTTNNNTNNTNSSLNVGDKVKIIGTGNGASDGSSNTAYSIGWTREILKIYAGRKFPYQVGNSTGTTGFYKASALQKM